MTVFTPPASPAPGKPPAPMVGFIWDSPDNPLPLAPEFQVRRDNAIKDILAGKPPADSLSNCVSAGVVRMMAFGRFEILQTPGRVTIISELLSDVRRIWTDGRPHPSADDFEPSYLGHSIGRWEGDTLVVDTIHIKPNSIDQVASSLTEQLRVTERIRKLDATTLENEITLLDPAALTKPYTGVKRYRRAPDGTEIPEYTCDIQRNPAGPDGRIQTAKPE